MTPRWMKWVLLGADLTTLAGAPMIYLALRGGGSVHGAASAGTWGFLGISIFLLYIFNCYNVESKLFGLGAGARAGGAVVLAASIVAVAVTPVASSSLSASGLSWVATLPALAGLVAVVYGLRRLAGRFVRRRLRRMRWLVCGDVETLECFARDFAKDPRGEAVYSELWRWQEGPDVSAVGAAPAEGAELAPADWSGVVIATYRELPRRLAVFLGEASLNGVRILDLVSFYERVWQKVPTYSVNVNSVLCSSGFAFAHHTVGRRAKRLIDLVMAVLVLLASAPLLAVAAAAIVTESGRPVLFRQRRDGQHGRGFELYKLRTMRHDAEAGGVRWASERDPRVTPVGRVLRLTRIDEIPQAYNVLRGDMSFIGPRPERPEFNARLREEIPGYDLRHLMKPGVTGWAQVLYPYGASVEDAREKLAYDLYYIRNYSIVLDIAILVKTVRVVFLGRGR